MLVWRENMKAINIAKYFLSKDKDRSIFNNKVVQHNGRKFYEGNARLNKYLFLSQVVYLAKYGERLFEDDFSAYENGPVVENIMQEYPRLNTENIEMMSDAVLSFLDKMYMSLENASFEELIEITHEDPEWIKLKNNTYIAPTMNLEENIDEYKKKYKGFIEALDI